MTPPDKSFVFAPRFNQPMPGQPPNDATGAFQPGMALYQKYYEGMGKQVITHIFDNHAPGPARRQSILDAMQNGCGGVWYDAIVYFGHGTKNTLASAAFTQAERTTLTDAIWDYGTPGVKVVLYACDCAVPGGIAYQMAQDLNCWANYGMEVYGHALPGHSYANAALRRYPSSKGETGETVCPAGKVAAWLKAMADEKGMLWARVPFMTLDEIANSV